ncbi:MAG: hypothetical protein KVP17_001471 [Porospora cf. gigantea B]|uniref:uncharacterized protein n=1 Tax=Porospora cf. gigantea B TaxID=2853592 RepID=UPI00357182ED|nr:MAG: hypothetical protein KVP17_001471 [Porospora cf. gigantea B]
MVRTLTLQNGKGQHSSLTILMLKDVLMGMKTQRVGWTEKLPQYGICKARKWKSADVLALLKRMLCVGTQVLSEIPVVQRTKSRFANVTTYVTVGTTDPATLTSLHLTGSKPAPRATGMIPRQTPSPVVSPSVRKRPVPNLHRPVRSSKSALPTELRDTLRKRLVDKRNELALLQNVRSGTAICSMKTIDSLVKQLPVSAEAVLELDIKDLRAVAKRRYLPPLARVIFDFLKENSLDQLSSVLTKRVTILSDSEAISDASPIRLRLKEQVDELDGLEDEWVC